MPLAFDSSQPDDAERGRGRGSSESLDRDRNYQKR
jgi:hypothetical protein